MVRNDRPMTALEHLRQLVGEGCDDGPKCFFCYRFLVDDESGVRPILGHAPDCKYEAAKAFVGQEDAVAKHLDGSNPESWAKFHGPYVSRPGFTLIELLVVIFIILLVSILTIPSISGAISHRQVGEAARSLSAVLAGARDAAIRDNRPSGIRLIQDPAFSGIQPLTLPDGTANPSPFAGRLDPGLALAYNRIVPIAPAPSYSEGFALQVTGVPAEIGALAYPGPGSPSTPTPPGPLVSGTNVLVLAEAVVSQVTGTNGLPATILNPPTTWFWNIRLGDKIQINDSGPWYTVVGPMVVTPSQGNPDLFVNVGQPGTPLPWSTTQFGETVTPEFLLLVNGRDDNGNGWIDEGWDGVDNDGANGTDDIGEWKETETWLGSPPSATQLTYSVTRRPVPQMNAREIQLPSDVVIDASGWNTGTAERTRVPSVAFNQFTGTIDIMISPDGSVVPTTLYSSPSSIGMAGAFYHLWLAERGDVYAPVTPLVAGGAFSLPMPIDTTFQADPTAAVDPTKSYAVLLRDNPSLPVIKGEIRLATLFSRTGQALTEDNPTFNVANVNQPFLTIQQGAQ